VSVVSVRPLSATRYEISAALSARLALPVYQAAMVCVPLARALELQVARPVSSRPRAARVAPSTAKLTVPCGVAAALGPMTVAVKVTVWPKCELSGEAERRVSVWDALG